MLEIIKKIREWWFWLPYDKIKDEKLKKLVLRGVITPREAVKAEKRRKIETQHN